MTTTRKRPFSGARAAALAAAGAVLLAAACISAPEAGAAGAPGDSVAPAAPGSHAPAAGPVTQGALRAQVRARFQRMTDAAHLSPADLGAPVGPGSTARGVGEGLDALAGLPARIFDAEAVPGAAPDTFVVGAGYAGAVTRWVDAVEAAGPAGAPWEARARLLETLDADHVLADAVSAFCRRTLDAANRRHVMLSEELAALLHWDRLRENPDPEPLDLAQVPAHDRAEIVDNELAHALDAWLARARANPDAR